MSDKKKLEKVYTVEKSPQGEWSGYDQYDTFEEAEQEARRRAYNNGEDYFVMGPIAKAKAPVEVNTVHVEKIT
jgi:hypothetical protein